MFAISSIVPIARQHVLVTALRIGQTFRATVHGTGDKPVLLLAGARIPLEGDAGIAPGQAVDVEVVESGAGLALRVTPHAAPAQQATPVSDVALRAALTAALHALGAPQQADAAQTIAPRILPPSPSALRQLLALFFERGTLGSDLERIQGWIAQAAEAGAAPKSGTVGVLGVLAALAAGDVRAFAAALDHLARTRSTAARLVQYVAGTADGAMDGLDDFLTAYLARLAAHEPFRRFLRSQGTLRSFDAAVRRVEERLDGAALQNLRGLDQAYLFLELPLPADSGLRYAQVHFFGSGRGFEKDNVFIAIDVSTTRMGDLWVTLGIVGGTCRCHFRATETATVEAIRASAAELTEALRAAGYPRVAVDAALWDGDRIRETAALMRRISGLDVRG